MSARASLKRGGVALGSIGAATLLYRLLATPPDPQLGSNRGRSKRAAAGDELLEEADGVATRAITIDAPASAVWPWIAQMGPSPRGGAYTYDWIENLLGLDMHSTDRVLCDYEHPQVGDTLGYGKSGSREFNACRAVGESPLSPPSTSAKWTNAVTSTPAAVRMFPAIRASRPGPLRAPVPASA